MTHVARASRGRIRVVYVIGSLSTGGTQKHLSELLHRLDRDRFEPMVIVLRGGGAFADRLREDRVPVYVVEVSSRSSLVYGFFRFARLVRRLQPDILHLLLFHSSLYGCLYKLLPFSRVRVVLSKRSMDLKLRRYRRLVYRYILMRVPDIVTAVSNAVAARCIQLGAERAKVRVIPNGLDLIPSAPGGRLRQWLEIPADASIVGAVGSLTRRKCHASLIDAFAKVASRYPLAHLVVLGEGTLRARLETQVQQLGLSGRVHLPGAVTPATDYMSDFDVFALPSSEEGTSNALLEAMALGIPAVVSAIPAHRDLSTDAAAVVTNTENPSELAQALERLLLDPGLRAQLASNARAALERRFPVEPMIRLNEQLYVAMVEQRDGTQILRDALWDGRVS